MRSDEFKREAIRIFASNGYEATTMQQIAEALSVKKPSVYTHFKSKKELYLIIINDLFSLYVDSIKSELAELTDKSIKNVFSKVFFYTVDFLSDKQRLFLWKKAFNLAADTTDNEIGSSLYAIITWMNQRVFEESSMNCIDHIHNDDIESVSFIFSTFLLGFVETMYFYYDKNIDITSMAQKAWYVFWNGFHDSL